MKETVIESPLIGSGSQEEVDLRVNALIDLGKSRGFLTYEELNEKLPDEVVSPDKLDSLLMMIDEMGIKLIDEYDIGDFIKGPKAKATIPTAGGGGGVTGKFKEPAHKKKHAAGKVAEPGEPGADEDEEEIDLNLEAEL